MTEPDTSPIEDEKRDAMSTFRKSSNMRGRCYPAPRPLPPNFAQLARDADLLFVEVEHMAENFVRRGEVSRRKLPPFGLAARPADLEKRCDGVIALVRALCKLTDERWKLDLLTLANHRAKRIASALQDEAFARYMRRVAAVADAVAA